MDTIRNVYILTVGLTVPRHNIIFIMVLFFIDFVIYFTVVESDLHVQIFIAHILLMYQTHSNTSNVFQRVLMADL